MVEPCSCQQHPVTGKFHHFVALTAFLILSLAPAAHAETISGTVLDPSGAVIARANIEITGGDLKQPILLVSDDLGNFTSPDLAPATYSVKVTRQDFEPLVQTVDLHAGPAKISVRLEIANAKTNVVVSAKHMEFANSDPIYRQLRSVRLNQAFRIENFTAQFDVGTFHFDKGTVVFLAPVNGAVTGAVFVGEGHFNLKPVTALDMLEMKRRSGAVEMDEDFTEAVFRFTPDAQAKFLPALAGETTIPPDANAVFDHWKDKMRSRREEPMGFTEAVLHGGEMDNVDADVLAALYNPNHPPFFNAYFHGKKHKDLRFFVRNRVGALPQFESPEEAALINYDPEGMDDGIWYLSHLKSEFVSRTASSHEERRLFTTKHYTIETVVAKNDHLFSTATVNFEPLLGGERVLKFGLLPNLRVTRVIDDQGQDLHFIQESRKEDGSFYAILREPVQLGKQYSVTVQYEGDKVLEKAGDGSYYVRARTSWYPNLNGFGERALYDLTYKVPRRYKVISVGKLQGESNDRDFAVTHWITPAPVAVAGFNYGDYKKLEVPDTITGYKLSGYYLSELPDRLRNSALRSMAPGSMTKYALEQTRAQLQLCTYYFGKSPYDEIYVTEQPDFNFGQSWPNLVYLPISAYTDSTQRWMLFGNINSRFTGFVQEVTPHEVAHQWWGHSVGWASYHDQWLSEGFAEFSAGLFLQQAVGEKWQKDYIEFWDRLRKRILEKNSFGIAPNDAGPLWMGLRLASPRSPEAYQNVTYPKGAYVLQMLRSMMYSSHDQDKAFIAMMHDFVEKHRDMPASTESFKSIAEKHITKAMDFQGNGRLDWFFKEWVYGTQVPRYRFEYKLEPAEGRKVTAHLTLTQSEVNDQFAMLVPVFADFGKGWIRIGQIPAIGNTSQKVDVVLPEQPKNIALNVFKDVLER